LQILKTADGGAVQNNEGLPPPSERKRFDLLIGWTISNFLLLFLMYLVYSS
jgi:hypothetical protein